MSRAERPFCRNADKDSKPPGLRPAGAGELRRKHGTTEHSAGDMGCHGRGPRTRYLPDVVMEGRGEIPGSPACSFWGRILHFWASAWGFSRRPAVKACWHFRRLRRFGVCGGTETEGKAFLRTLSPALVLVFGHGIGLPVQYRPDQAFVEKASDLAKGAVGKKVSFQMRIRVASASTPRH